MEAVGFLGQGCAISKSSASIMTTMIEGKSSAEAERLKEAFIRLLTRDTVPSEDRQLLGRLKIFEGVKQYPVRVKCATLIWRALEAALKNSAKREVSTERTEP
jgi:nitrogen fixation NifU-like protein